MRVQGGENGVVAGDRRRKKGDRKEQHGDARVEMAASKQHNKRR